ncbi:MAG: hypothetical protein ACRC3Y_03535 [Romboutsia sp.]
MIEIHHRYEPLGFVSMMAKVNSNVSHIEKYYVALYPRQIKAT